MLRLTVSPALGSRAESNSPLTAVAPILSRLFRQRRASCCAVPVECLLHPGGMAHGQPLLPARLRQAGSIMSASLVAVVAGLCGLEFRV